MIGANERIVRETVVISLFVVVAFTVGFCRSARGENWPMWRGPRGDGSSTEKTVCAKWSAAQNVLWKTRIPGKGHASPIVWGERVFVVTAIPEQELRVLLCVDARDGQILWQRGVLTAMPEKTHSLNSFASSTPATDGERIYVSFLDVDKMFVAAYDFEGTEVWAVRPGAFASQHGYCSNPILYRDRVIVNGDHDGPAYIVALDGRTGRSVWTTPRPNNTRSYCTPIIRQIGGRIQMVLSGSKCVASYDPDTGEQHWIIDGPTEQYVASLVFNGELFFMTCGFPDRFIQAIRPDGSGNVTKTHVLWQTTQDASYVPSPAWLGTHFYVVSDTGVATCFEAKTGRVCWRERLGPHFSASLITANGLVYFLSDKGVTTVVKDGGEFDVVARNELGEEIYASPAVSEGRLYIRALNNLYCIGEP